MKKSWLMLSVVAALSLSGCAGLTSSDRVETQAFRDYQNATAKVTRKNIKLEMAIKLADKASEGVVEARKELEDAQAEAVLAKKKLDDQLAL